MPIRAALAFCLLAAPAGAAELYECRFTGENTWVPTVVVIEPGRQGETVAVSDPLIRHFLQGPTQARVETDNAVRTTFTWSYTVKSDANQTARMNFRLTRQKADGRASLSVQALDYVGPFAGQGACSVIEGRL